MAPHVGRAPLKKRTAAAACFSPAYRVSSWRHGAETDLAATYIVDDVVKAQVFMTDLRNFCGFDEVWKEYFKVPPPRTTVGTSGLLVKDTLVEIDLIGTR